MWLWFPHLRFGPHERSTDVTDPIIPQLVLHVTLDLDVRLVLEQNKHSSVLIVVKSKTLPSSFTQSEKTLFTLTTLTVGGDDNVP